MRWVSLLILILLTSVSSVWAAYDKAAKGHYGRIISFYSAHTENLVSLCAQELLIGISTSFLPRRVA